MKPEEDTDLTKFRHQNLVAETGKTIIVLDILRQLLGTIEAVGHDCVDYEKKR